MLRIFLDLEEFKKVKPANAWGGPKDGKLNEWEISFYGPKGSDYENGLFNVKIIFPKDYPKSKPDCYFMHKDLYHPNIAQDGLVCLGNNFWNENKTICNVIYQIYDLLKFPNFNDSWDYKIKATYDEDKSIYHLIVKDLVKKNAPNTPNIPFPMFKNYI